MSNGSLPPAQTHCLPGSSQGQGVLALDAPALPTHLATLSPPLLPTPQQGGAHHFLLSRDRLGGKQGQRKWRWRQRGSEDPGSCCPGCLDPALAQLARRAAVPRSQSPACPPQRFLLRSSRCRANGPKGCNGAGGGGVEGGGLQNPGPGMEQHQDAFLLHRRAYGF